MARKQVPYSPEYIERCFRAWMGAGHPYQLGRDMSIYPEDETGRVVGIPTLRLWRKKYGWEERAADIEQKAIEQADLAMVDVKANILKQQFEDAQKIAAKALFYLTTEEFDSSASAVSAYFRSTEEQRRSVGISEIIEKMTKMSDTELEEELRKRIQRATDAGQLIDAELLSEEDEDTSEEDTS